MRKVILTIAAILFFALPTFGGCTGAQDPVTALVFRSSTGVLVNNACEDRVTGIVTYLGISGAIGLPAGADTQVQFNDAGALAGNAAFTFIKAAGKVVLVPNLDTGTALSVAAHSATQSVTLADFSNTSTVSPTAAFTFRGKGLGAFAVNPIFAAGAQPAIVHIAQESDAPWALAITNKAGAAGEGLFFEQDSTFGSVIMTQNAAGTSQPTLAEEPGSNDTILLFADNSPTNTNANISLVPGGVGTTFANNHIGVLMNAISIVAGDFVLTGWGAAPILALGTEIVDQAGVITITAGAAPAANPTVQFTFHNGAFHDHAFATVAPFCSVSQGSGGTGILADISSTVTATKLTLTFNATPTNASTYVLFWNCLEGSN